MDVLDQINNQGRPLEEYSFWPDVLDGLKEMFTRTQFAMDQGGYFPQIKVRQSEEEEEELSVSITESSQQSGCHFMTFDIT